MNFKKFKAPLIWSCGYLFIVMLILLWWELSRGWGEFDGVIPGLLLILITMPGALFESKFVGLFSCVPDVSTCAHVVGTLFAAGINAIVIFFVFYIGKGNDSEES